MSLKLHTHATNLEWLRNSSSPLLSKPPFLRDIQPFPFSILRLRNQDTCMCETWLTTKKKTLTPSTARIFIRLKRCVCKLTIVNCIIFTKATCKCIFFLSNIKLQRVTTDHRELQHTHRLIVIPLSSLVPCILLPRSEKSQQSPQISITLMDVLQIRGSFRLEFIQLFQGMD